MWSPSKSIAKRRIKALKHLKLWLWGAAGIDHMLIDAPAPTPILPTSGPKPSAALVSRIIKCYQAGDANFRNTAPSMWDEIERRQNAFVTALRDGDQETVSDLLGNMFVNTIAEGMGHSHSSVTNDWRPGFFGLRMTDYILSLAEALAIIPLPSFGQMKAPDYIKFTQADPAELLAKIQDRLGYSLETPEHGCPPTFVLGAIRTNIDIIRHGYEIERLRQLGIQKSDRIVEIGGGIGAVALLAGRAGYQDYTIIDLPYVGSIQTYYLGSALGEDKVSGLGESPAAFKMLPPPEIKNIPDKSVDLVININSMPEMGAAACEDYLRDIRRIAKKFLSINQESQGYHPGIGRQNWVPGIIKDVGGYTLLNRHKYWLGEGYTEELYAIDG